MSNNTYRDKYEFMELMQRKRGIHYTLGWLKSAYAMPKTPEVEADLMQLEKKKLQAMPDYEGV